MKKRTYTFVTMGLAAALGTVLFLTSERVQRAERELQILQQKISIERDGLQVLRAEWTYLNRPERLEDLAATHLRLSPLALNGMMADPHLLPVAAPVTLPRQKPTLIPVRFQSNHQPIIAVRTTPPQTAPTRIEKPATVTHKVDNSTFYQMMNRVNSPRGNHD